MRLKFLPSFVKRRGRITNKQEHSLKSLSDFSVFTIDEILLELKNFNQCCLEIGFGNAEHIVQQAINYPNTLFIGSEVYMSGIGTLISKIKENNIKNIKIFSDDIRLLLDQENIEIFDSVQIICPDPWPKDRHHKRRLINKDFLSMIHGFIKDKGNLYISTDWENYAESIQNLFGSINIFKESNKMYLEKNRLTKFEKRGENEGREIYIFNYEKSS